MDIFRNRLCRAVFSRSSRTGLVGCLLRKAYAHFFDFPKVLQLSITDRCNLDCVYCYVDRKENRDIPAGKCFHMLRQAREMKTGIVAFTGGEPFLHPRFREILTRAHELGLDIEILTNGTNITDEWVGFLGQISKKGRLSVVFKFSHDKETYRLHTKADMFDAVTENIKKCASSGVDVFTFTVLTRHEYAHLDRILEDSKRLGAWPVFQRYIPARDQETNAALGIGAEEYRQGLLSLRDFYQRNKEVYGEYSYLSARLRGSICACYRDMAVITAGGDILPCPAAPSELSIGNIKDISLKEAWRLYKKEKREWLKMSPDCIRCKVNDICGGGCISHKYLASGRFDVNDPLCFQPDRIASVEGLSAPCRMHEGKP